MAKRASFLHVGRNSKPRHLAQPAPAFHFEMEYIATAPISFNFGELGAWPGRDRGGWSITCASTR